MKLPPREATEDNAGLLLTMAYDRPLVDPATVLTAATTYTPLLKAILVKLLVGPVGGGGGC